MEIFSPETLQNVTMSSHMHLRILGIAVICGFHIFKPMNMNTGPRTGPNKRIHMKDMKDKLFRRPITQCRFYTGPVGLDSTDESISSWRFFL